MKSTTTRILLVVVAGLFAACGAPGITDSTPQEGGGSVAPLLGELLNGPKLLKCRTDQTTSSTSVVSAVDGGVVSVGGSRISIPAGALLSDATVTLTVPASKYVEIDVSVAGTDDFIFELPVTITISYDRCDPWRIPLAPLSAWVIDSETKALLEFMGGVDNRLARTVTFITPHLTGFSIAN